MDRGVLAERGKPELVIFDLDGTLIDTESTSVKTWIMAAKEFGITLKEEEIYPFIGRNAASISELARRNYGPTFPFQEIYDYKRALSRDIFSKELKAMPGAEALLKLLKESDVKTCVATSSSRDRSLRFLDKVGLGQYIDFLISGDEVTHSKPDPEIFNKCLQKAGVTTQAAWVVEDSENGIIAAKKSQCAAILVPDLILPTKTMEEHADAIFLSLFEVKVFWDELIKEPV